MIAIDQLSHDGKPIPLGQAAEFRLRWETAAPPPSRVRVCVRSNGVLHVTPLFDWSRWEDASQPFGFFPESPGEHALRVRWERPEGGGDSVERSVKVLGPGTVTNGPQLATLDDGATLWTPSAWEAQELRHHERQVLAVLPEYVRPGSVVYDIGANLGLYSIACGRLAAGSGRIYCFEANPLCLYFLRANLSSNGIVWSEIFPVALSDRSAQLEFTINYDNLNLGIGRDSPVFSAKAGHRIQLASRDLDGLVEEFGLRPPTLVKMDIEGAEASAVRGMTQALGDHRPVLLIELHGRGAAGETLALLDGFGYGYRDLGSGRRFTSGGELVAQMPDQPIQIVATPR